MGDIVYGLALSRPNPCGKIDTLVVPMCHKVIEPPGGLSSEALWLGSLGTFSCLSSSCHNVVMWFSHISPDL
jgi:hypothetical protein